MRVLHTSDWHLGRSFHRVGLLDAQATFVDHLVETVRAERVDVVVVSGDIFDRALAPIDAVALGSTALRRLLDAGVRVVMTSGNHDSAARLGFAAELIDASGIHLRTDPAAVGIPVVIADQDGPVAFYGIPYLEPDLVAVSWSLPQRSHQAALDEAMRRVRADLATRRPGTRSVVLAHVFAAGADPCESERDISVGGVQRVGLSTFDGVDYTALGHLHGRQTLAPAVRYSGSPLAYSFSERHHHKGSWLVELDRQGLGVVEFVPAPVPRPLAVISGTLDDLMTDSSLSAVEQSWVQVTLTDVRRPKRAMERLQQRFPHTLVLSFEPPTTAEAGSPEHNRSVVGRSDAQIVADFVLEVAARRITPAEATLLQQACDACRVSEDAAS